MKPLKILPTFLLLFFVGFASYGQEKTEESTVRQLIIDSYLTPLYKNGKVEAIRAGFN
ncbi:MAG: hypothetical protein AAF969_04865 [Bacteroidota bacterium]